MAHVASCMADMDQGHSLKSPDASRNSPVTTEKPFTWRMQQQHPEQQRKYQLFPKDRQLPVLNSSKNMDPEKAFALAMQTTDKHERPSAAAGLRIRVNQHQFSSRRRKVSVAETGHMTTVQEIPMDSPTIPDRAAGTMPGRPPLHERSASAPGGSANPRKPADTFLSLVDDEEAELEAAINEAYAPLSIRISGPLSPKSLAPLVIPQSNNTRPPPLVSKRSLNHLRSGSTPAEIWRPTRVEDSPMRASLLSPSTSSSDLTTPRSACTTVPSATTLPTPISAPVMESYRSSPKPWEGRCTTPAGTERSATPLDEELPRPNPPYAGHRRGASESSSVSIMDRGRPRKRSDPRHNRNMSKGSESRPLKSAERKAFEELPQGWKPSEAADAMNAVELASLQKQAYSQVARFEVLKAEDVESLSKELRNLDERTEYLRRTFHSLRAGRRNLHSRICQYLRSPRVAKFSHESMLKQEEALAELDTSIDDWVTKLEIAENRRTRVRQKLLEHVAAAATLNCRSSTDSPQKAVATERLVALDISTPPRSPTKHAFTPSHSSSSSPSPQRVVAQVPSTILEHPIREEAAALEGVIDRVLSISSMHSDAESIRIYAGNDVYSLLADVEDQIARMGSTARGRPSPETMETKRRELHRQRSHEMLTGLLDKTPVTTLVVPAKDLNSATPLSPPAPTPPLKDEPTGTLLLTSAVFRP